MLSYCILFSFNLGRPNEVLNSSLETKITSDKMYITQFPHNCLKLSPSSRDVRLNLNLIQKPILSCLLNTEQQGGEGKDKRTKLRDEIITFQVLRKLARYREKAHILEQPPVSHYRGADAHG